MRVSLIGYGDIDVIKRAIAITHGNETADDELIRKIISWGHESCLEHLAFNFEILGISRICLAQLTRHRIASYSVRSQRYCDERNGTFYVPDNIIGAKPVIEHISAAMAVYRQMIEVGIPEEDARYILPQAIETDLIMTMNVRSLRNFFRLRFNKHAQKEIRDLASLMHKLCIEVYPILFEDIKEASD